MTSPDTPQPDDKQRATELQAWREADELADLSLDELLALLADTLADMDEYNANQRYAESCWSREYGGGWYSGDRVGR